MPSDPADPDSIRTDRLAPWLALATDSDGREHAVLSDGWHRIRIDVEEGSIAREEAVLLQYRLLGIASAEPKILPLRRFLELCRRDRFAQSLFPRDPRIERWLTVLRVHDALAAGASQREIGAALFGEDRIVLDWHDDRDSLRSRVRRLVRDARAMARGGYRYLMRQRS
ncbi:DNA -binding domain-containing protein [Sphingomonas sp.]|uniref:DNA -binding domain-containing protein n=1 Tax=Sphingomonas sp. TaxID=28214 RepID=UPI003F730F8B